VLADVTVSRFVGAEQTREAEVSSAVSALSWVHPGTIMVIPLEWGCFNNSALSTNTEPISSREMVIGCAHPGVSTGASAYMNATMPLSIPLVLQCIQSLTGEWLFTPEQPAASSFEALPASFVVPLLTKTVPLQGCVHNMKLKYYVGPQDAATAAEILRNTSTPMTVRLLAAEYGSRPFSLAFLVRLQGAC
jgi:hypothetical protein